MVLPLRTSVGASVLIRTASGSRIAIRSPIEPTPYREAALTAAGVGFVAPAPASIRSAALASSALASAGLSPASAAGAALASSAAGALVASSISTIFASGALVGSAAANLAAIGRQIIARVVSASGTGGMSGTALMIRTGAASLSGTGGSSGTGRMLGPGSLAGSGTGGTSLVGSTGSLDAQTVTTGASGSLPNRQRGYHAVPALGSIADGTSNVYAGAAVTELYYSEDGVDGSSGIYVLRITGATNSGWTTLTIGSKALLRAAADSFLGGQWQWITSDTIGTQAFGASSNVVNCSFT